MSNGVKYGIEIRVDGNKEAVHSFDEVTQAQSRTGEAAKDAGEKIGKHFSEINVGAAAAVKAQTNVGESWAKSGTAAQEASKKIVKGNEDALAAQQKYEKEQQKQEKERQSTQARLERDQQRFIESLSRKSDAIGKTNSQLAALRAQELGVSDAAAPMIAKLAQTEQGVARVGMSAAATAAAMRNVPAQFTDIVVSLQAGQSPMTVMMQQGGQLKDMFGGVGGAAKALGGYVLGLINPLTLTAAAVGVLGYAYYQGSQEAKEFNRQMQLTGGYAGVTYGQFNELADSVSKSTNTSIGNAKETLQGIVSTGKFTSETLKLVTTTVVNFSERSNQSSAEVIAMFGKMTDGVGKWASETNKQYHFLTASQYSQIVSLEEQGKKTEAVKIAMESFNAAIPNQAKNIGTLEKAWRGVANATSAFWNDLKGIGAEETAEEKVKRLKELAQTGNRQSSSSKARFGNLIDEDQNDLVKQKAASDLAIAEFDRKLDAKIARLKAERAEINQTAIAAIEADKARKESFMSRSQQEQKAANEYWADQVKIRAADKINNTNYADDTKKVQEVMSAIHEKYKERNNDLKKQENTYKSFLVTLKEKLALSEAELGNERNLTEGQKLRIKFDADLRAGTIKATAVQIDHARSITTQIDVNNRLEISRKEDLKSAGEQADATVKLTNSVDDYISSLANSNEQTALELKLAHESEGKRKIAIEQQKIALELKKQINAINNSNAFEEEKPNLIQKATNAAEKRKESIVVEVDMDEMRKARKELDAFLDPAKAQSFGDALVGSLNNAGNALQKLSVSLQEYGRTEAELAKARDNAEKSRALDPAKYAQSIAAINERSTRAQIQSYASIAGAAKGFFAEGTRGYKALESVEKIYHATQLAMNLSSVTAKLLGISSVTAATVTGEATKSAAVTAGVGTEIAANAVKGASAAAVGIATQAQGDAYTAIPRMAAMAAIMAGLGFATGIFGSSGDGGMKAEDVQKQQGTGSVFGDLTAKSDSIAKSIDDMSKSSSRLLPVNQGMLAALKNIESSMAGFTNLVVRDQGVIDGSNLGIKTGMLSGGTGVTNLVASIGEKVFGSSILGTLSRTISNLFSNTKQTIVDSGVQYGGKLSDLQAGKGFSQYASVDTTKSSWFGLSKSTSNSIQSAGLSNELSSQLGLIFTSMNTALREANKALGGSATDIEKTLKDLTLAGEKVSLKGLSGTALTEALNSVISKSLDEMASAAFPQYERFREVGEGYAQTVLRVANTFASVNQSLGEINLKLFDVGQAGVEASLGLAKTLGGLENLQSVTTGYLQDFFTEEERAAKIRTALAKELSGVGIALPADRQSYRTALENASNAGQQEVVATMLNLAQAFASVTEEAKSAAEQSEALTAKLAGVAELAAKTAGTDRRDELAVRRSAEQAQDVIRKASEDSFKALVESVNKGLKDLVLAGNAAGALASKMSISGLRTSDYKKDDGSFNAGAYNTAAALAEAKQAKSLIGDASYDAINIKNVQGFMQELYGKIFSDDLKNTMKSELASSVKLPANGLISQAIDGLLEAGVKSYQLTEMVPRSQGISSVIAARMDLAFASYDQGAMKHGKGADVNAFGTAIENLNWLLKKGAITAEEHASAVQSSNKILGDSITLLNNEAGQKQRIINAQNQLVVAGTDSIAFYFAQIGKSVASMTDAAKVASEPIAQVADSIGRLQSLSYVFGESYKAATSGDQAKVTRQVDNAKIVADAATRAASMITTQDAARVAKTIKNDAAFSGLSDSTLRDVSLLLDGVKQFDPKSFEKSFMRLNNALDTGAINVDQYGKLFDESVKSFNGVNEAGFNGVSEASAQLEQKMKNLGVSMGSFADRMLIDKENSTLRPEQRIEEMVRQYDVARLAAKSGDADAIAKYEEVATSLIDKNLYSNVAEFNAISGRIYGDARALENLAAKANGENVVAELKNLNDVLSKRVDGLEDSLMVALNVIASNTRSTSNGIDGLKIGAGT